MYEELDNTTFVPLICVHQNLLGKYEVNKLAQIRNKITGHIMSIDYSQEYPRVGLSYTVNKHKKTITYLIHLVIAKTFIPNSDPINKTQVHHINGDKNDFRIDNLEWISPPKHASITNSKRGPKDVSFLIFVKTSPNGLIDEVPATIFSKEERGSIYKSIRKNKTYKGFYWSVKNLEVESYYSNFTEEQKSCETWAINNYHGYKIFISNLGVYYSERGAYPKLGGKRPNGYRIVSFSETEGRNIGVHVLVAETFILGRKTTPGEIVDHKNGNKEDNSIWNLSVGTQKDNMNNPLTKEKRYKEIGMYTINGVFIMKFKSTDMAVELLSNTFKSMSRGNINSCLVERSVTSGGFLFAYQD